MSTTVKLDRNIDVDLQLLLCVNSCLCCLSTLPSSSAPIEILSPQERIAISVNETDSVSLVCSARGFPAMDITWWYQNTQLMDSHPGLSIQSMTEESVNGFLDTTSTLWLSLAWRMRFCVSRRRSRYLEMPAASSR